jgi:hypothetical protein
MYLWISSLFRMNDICLYMIFICNIYIWYLYVIYVLTNICIYLNMYRFKRKRRPHCLFIRSWCKSLTIFLYTCICLVIYVCVYLVYIYVYTYVCIYEKHIEITSLLGLYAYMYVRTCINLIVHMHLYCKCIYTVYINISIYVHMCTHLIVYIYLCM